MIIHSEVNYAMEVLSAPKPTINRCAGVKQQNKMLHIQCRFLFLALRRKRLNTAQQ